MVLVCEVGDILDGTETMLSREAIEDSAELEDAYLGYTEKDDKQWS